MKYIYIASKYKGNAELNTKRAKRYARFVALQGMMPIVPHIYLTEFLDDNIQHEREIGLKLGLQLLKFATELWVFGTNISEGMAGEIKYATEHRIQIRYFDMACNEIRKSAT